MVVRHRHFKKSVLASVISSITLAGAAVQAQNSETVEEEVIVTGIRASLQRSMDLKRDASGVVDAITAEDIGKFPDSNLAESLQRITGVSIDRKNGEGFQVTVRGFGPSFNLVTLNGRSLPASQLGARGGAVASRSFDMSNIASEGVSGVEVYKTGKANVTSGGIGATVNLKTLRPMDTDGFRASAGVKIVNDTTNRVGRDYTPELSGLMSWSNDMFGALVSASVQERDSAQAGVFTNGWADYSGAWSGSQFFEGIPDDDPAAQSRVIIGNEPAAGQQTNQTPGVRYHYGDYERKRKNAQVALQFSPMETFTATLDYTYAHQELFVNSSELSFWFGGGSFPPSDVFFDGNDQVATPLYFWAENQDGGLANGNVRDLGVTQNQGAVQNELQSVGINLDFQATENLSFVLDAHDSESESMPADGAIANYFNIGVGIQGVYGQGYDNSGDLPLIVGAYRDRYPTDHDNDDDTPPIIDIRDGGLFPGFLDVADLGSTVRQINFDRTRSETTQIKLDGKFEFDNGSIDFGVDAQQLEATQRASFDQTVLEGNWGVGTPGDIPATMIREVDYASVFDGYATSLSPQARAWFDAAGTTDPVAGDGSTTGRQGEVFLQGFIAEDVNALGALLSRNAGLDWAPNPSDNTNRTISEDILAVYVQGNMTWEIGGQPLNATLGLRYEETDVESEGQVGVTTFVWQGDNDFTSNQGSPADAPLTRGEGSYDHLLPNLDLSYNFTDDIVGRFSASRTISRTAYNNLLEGINNVQPPRGGPTILGTLPGDANSGDPSLLPIESDNLDVSFEWYYGDASYASVGYYYKDVPNFIGTAVTTETVSATLDPSNGPRAQEAISELQSRGLAVNQQNLFRMMASLNSVAGGCVNNPNAPDGAAQCGDAFDSAPYEEPTGWENGVDLVAVAGDPAYVANVRRPVNSQDATIDGFELALQHFFWDTGFGIQANYTTVDGDIEFDITGSATETQFALVGLSDSANVALIYENDALSARVAWNWRDKFLDNTGINANEPQFTEEYEQIDFNVSYNFNDNFSMGLEGINVTGEDTRQHGRTARQLTRLEILGPRYSLLARYSF